MWKGKYDFMDKNTIFNIYISIDAIEQILIDKGIIKNNEEFDDYYTFRRSSPAIKHQMDIVEFGACIENAFSTGIMDEEDRKYIEEVGPKYCDDVDKLLRILTKPNADDNPQQYMDAIEEKLHTLLCELNIY